MKLTQLALVALGLAVLGLAGEAFYQRHVIDDAKKSLMGWSDHGPAFDRRFVGDQGEFREFCAKGISDVRCLEAEWNYMELGVTNCADKTASIALSKQDGRWLALSYWPAEKK